MQVIQVNTQIIDGKLLSSEIRSEITIDVNEFKNIYDIIPKLAVILVGNDPASQVYVRNKQRSAISVGMDAIDYKFSSNIYLSRSRLGSNADRCITNEKSLEEFFKNHNFSIIYPEDLNILEQIKIFRLAKILIAPFGATWANSIFRGHNTYSLMLSTKYTPEFSRIFQYLGVDLSVLNLIPVKVREEKNISKSYNFNVGENEFEMLIKYLKHINTNEI